MITFVPRSDMQLVSAERVAYRELSEYVVVYERENEYQPYCVWYQQGEVCVTGGYHATLSEARKDVDQRMRRGYRYELDT
jgi:hypothetical protein